MYFWILSLLIIISGGLLADTKDAVIFKVASGGTHLRVIADPKQPYWEGYNKSGKDPLSFHLIHGSRTASFHDCVGKLCGVLLEGLSIEISANKRISLDSEKNVSVLFKGKDHGVELSFKDITIELTTDEAIDLCNAFVEYYRKFPVK